MAKVDVKELEKAVKYLKEKLMLDQVDVEFGQLDRLLLKGGMDDHAVVITIYRSDTNKFADITETKRL